MTRHPDLPAGDDRSAVVIESVVTVWMEVLIAGRAVAAVFVVRRHVVEVWLNGTVRGTVGRADLAAWFEGATGSLVVPALKFAVPVNDQVPIEGEISISLPGLDDWRLSPTSRSELRAAVCANPPQPKNLGARGELSPLVSPAAGRTALPPGPRCGDGREAAAQPLEPSGPPRGELARRAQAQRRRGGGAR